MEHKYDRNTDGELLVLGLVSPYLHAEQRTYAATDECQPQESGFGNAPCLVLGTQLVNAVHDEGDYGNSQKIDKYYL